MQNIRELLSIEKAKLVAGIREIDVALVAIGTYDGVPVAMPAKAPRVSRVRVTEGANPELVAPAKKAGRAKGSKVSADTKAAMAASQRAWRAAKAEAIADGREWDLKAWKAAQAPEKGESFDHSPKAEAAE